MERKLPYIIGRGDFIIVRNRADSETGSVFDKRSKRAVAYGAIGVGALAAILIARRFMSRDIYDE